MSGSRTLDLSLPKIKSRELPYTLLNLIQLTTGIVFAFLLARTTILAKVQYVDVFELLVSALAIILAAQAVKAVLAGVKFFPESKFDLSSLLLAIGLISTLLLKQVLDLEGNQGMLPNQSAWHYTILGILLMLFGGYIFDVSFRKNFRLKNILLVLFASIQVLVVGKYIIDGEVFTSIAYLILALLPAFIGFGLELESYYFKVIYFVELILVALLGFLNLDLELAFVYMLALVLILGIGFLRRDYKLKDIRNLISYKKGSLKFKLVDSALYAVLNMLVALGLAMAVVLNLLFSDRTLGLLRSGLQDNIDVFKGIKAVEFMIGGGFDVSSQTFVSNVFSSYGLLGLVLFVVYFGSLALAARSLAGKPDKKSMFAHGLFGSLVLLGMLAFFFNYSMQVLIVLFLLGAVVANLSAQKEKKELEFEYLKVGGLKKEWQKYGARILQLVLIVLIAGGAIYTLFNIEGLFLS